MIFGWWRRAEDTKLEVKNPKMLYGQIQRGGLKLLQGLAEARETESEILDFKLATNQGLPLEIEDKVNLSKAISGFANSGGGVLVWGVYCNDGADKADCVQELRPIEKLLGFRSAIVDASVQLVTPAVKRIETHLILDGADRGYLVMLIPENPHLVQSITKKGKGFFERVGTSFLEIADDRLAARILAGAKRSEKERRMMAMVYLMSFTIVATVSSLMTYFFNIESIHPEMVHPVKRLTDGTVIIYPGRIAPKEESATEAEELRKLESRR